MAILRHHPCQAPAQMTTHTPFSSSTRISSTISHLLAKTLLTRSSVIYMQLAGLAISWQIFSNNLSISRQFMFCSSLSTMFLQIFFACFIFNKNSFLEVESFTVPGSISFVYFIQLLNSYFDLPQGFLSTPKG